VAKISRLTFWPTLYTNSVRLLGRVVSLASNAGLISFDRLLVNLPSSLASDSMERIAAGSWIFARRTGHDSLSALALYIRSTSGNGTSTI